MYRRTKTVSGRLFAVYRATAILVLNTLIFFVVLEFCAAAILSIITSPISRNFLAQIMGKPNDLIAHHYQVLPYYAEQTWTLQYWQEHNRALKKDYHPYVIWRSPPAMGETLNIDQNGHRLTPGAECSSEAYKVFMFGGSAMWGWGSPDWGTIPAYLQTKLQAIQDGPVCVVNFGENAYISTQNLIQLLLLLEADNVPDLVIFYDGVNDILAAKQTGQPMVHQNFTEIANRFQNSQPPLVEWFQELNSFKLLQMTLSQLGIRGAEEPPPPIDTDQLSGMVVQTYLNNYKIVATLAETYGFDYYFFWQPYILVGDKPLTPEEQTMITGLNWVFVLDPTLTDLFSITYERIEIEAGKYDHLYSMSNAFNKIETQIWIDTWGHTTPVGNEAVAQEMLAIIGGQAKEK